MNNILKKNNFLVTNSCLDRYCITTIFGSITFMKSGLTFCFAFALSILIGCQETILSFGLIESSVIERSEELPSRESQEHTLNVSSRGVRLTALNSNTNISVPVLYDYAFRTQVIFRPSFFKSSLHILFLSLRH